VELTSEALSETRLAFDGVARTYDRANDENPIIRSMRRRTLRAITARLAPGSSLIDLGCGPGADAAALGRLGYRVTAIDWSPAMAHEASRRIAGDRLQARVAVRAMGIHELERLEPGSFDGAYSDLGPLNCVPDLAAAARAVAARLREGGWLVASAIGRVCPWEIARYALVGDWRRIRVRFETTFVAVPLEGRTVWTRYYSPAEFAGVFHDAGFRTVALRAMSLLVPPPYLQGFYGRHPMAMRWLERVEDRIGGWPGVRRWGDHFLIVMKRI
jgi:SAM-dependent methyltransferase